MRYCWCTVLNTRAPLTGNGASATLLLVVITVHIGLVRLLVNGLRCGLHRLGSTFPSRRPHFIRHRFHAPGPFSTVPILRPGWRRLYLDLFHIHGIWRRFIGKHDFTLCIRGLVYRLGNTHIGKQQCGDHQ